MHCRLSGWFAGEGQRVMGATVRERGGVVRTNAEYLDKAFKGEL